MSRLAAEAVGQAQAVQHTAIGDIPPLGAQGDPRGRAVGLVGQPARHALARERQAHGLGVQAPVAQPRRGRHVAQGPAQPDHALHGDLQVGIQRPQGRDRQRPLREPRALGRARVGVLRPCCAEVLQAERPGVQRAAQPRAAAQAGQGHGCIQVALAHLHPQALQCDLRARLVKLAAQAVRPHAGQADAGHGGQRAQVRPLGAQEQPRLPGHGGRDRAAHPEAGAGGFQRGPHGPRLRPRQQGRVGPAAHRESERQAPEAPA